MDIARSNRLALLPDFYLAEIGKKIKILKSEGVDVIRLDIGSPDLAPPDQVIQTLSDVAKSPNSHGYQPHSGTKQLRQAWANYYLRNYNVKLNQSSEILPTIGSKEGIFHLSQAIINFGDIVLVPNPGYTTYERGTNFAGGIPYFLNLHVENDYLPDFDAVPIEIAEKAKIMWLNYPNNPTSAVATLDFFAEAVEFAKKYHILICHDAPYSQVYFDDKPPSILQIDGAKEIAVEFNSLSKSHNMAGWRVGAVVGNAEVVKSLAALKVNIDSGHFLPTMEATITALNTSDNWIENRNEIYKKRRDLIVSGLRKLGYQVQNPSASFYVWFSIPADQNAKIFVADLLAKTGVSLSPGTIFGTEGEGFARISLTQPLERLEEVLSRMSDWRN